MQAQEQPFARMPLTPPQQRLLIGMRVFLGLLAVLAIYDFIVGLAS